MSNLSVSWVPVASLLAFLSGLSSGCGNSEARASVASPLPQVTVASVVLKNTEDWGEFTGRLRAVESVELRARVPGFVTAAHFREGGRVKRNQLLFVIDARPFEAEASRLAATLERERASRDLAELQRARTQKLLAEQVVSAEVADRAEADARAAHGSVGAAEGALKFARLNLEFSQVRAPIDGHVSRAEVRPGNLVTTESVLTTIVSEDPIQVDFELDERLFLAFSAWRRGMPEGEQPAVFVGLVGEAGYPHRGRLDFVDNRLDPQTGLVRARAVLDNPDGRFTPGLFARVKLPLSAEHETVLIDDRAVGTDLGKRFVLVLGPNDSLRYQAVTLGPSLDGLRVVREGLVEGDVIVVNGLQRVRPGMRVHPARSDMRGTVTALGSAAGRPATAPAKN